MEHRGCYRRGQRGGFRVGAGRAGPMWHAGKRCQVQGQGRACADSNRFMITTAAQVRWHDMLQASGAA